MTDMLLPEAFFEVLTQCRELLQGSPETISVDVALAIADVVQASSVLSHTVHTDGRPTIEALLQQLLALQTRFDDLEDALHHAYPYEVHQGHHPPIALFRGKWHAYAEIWAARIWNHYRWARIILNEMLIKATTEYPISGARFLSPARRDQGLATIKRMAEDTLISTPSHWHHPVLDSKTAKMFGAPGQGGSGAAGIPTLMWHLKTAGCAMGVSRELWSWSYETMQVVWKEMGMQHAIAIAGVMEKERAMQEKEMMMLNKMQVKIEELGDDES